MRDELIIGNGDSGYRPSAAIAAARRRADEGEANAETLRRRAIKAEALADSRQERIIDLTTRVDAPLERIEDDTDAADAAIAGLRRERDDLKRKLTARIDAHDRDGRALVAATHDRYNLNRRLHRLARDYADVLAERDRLKRQIDDVRVELSKATGFSPCTGDVVDFARSVVESREWRIKDANESRGELFKVRRALRVAIDRDGLPRGRDNETTETLATRVVNGRKVHKDYLEGKRFRETEAILDAIVARGCSERSRRYDMQECIDAAVHDDYACPRCRIVRWRDGKASETKTPEPAAPKPTLVGCPKSPPIALAPGAYPFQWGCELELPHAGPHVAFKGFSNTAGVEVHWNDTHAVLVRPGQSFAGLADARRQFDAMTNTTTDWRCEPPTFDADDKIAAEWTPKKSTKGVARFR